MMSFSGSVRKEKEPSLAVTFRKLFIALDSCTVILGAFIGYLE